MLGVCPCYYRLSMFGDGRHVKARRFPRAVMLDPRFPFSCSLNKLSKIITFHLTELPPSEEANRDVCKSSSLLFTQHPTEYRGGSTLLSLSLVSIDTHCSEMLR